MKEEKHQETINEVLDEIDEALKNKNIKKAKAGFRKKLPGKAVYEISNTYSSK